MGTAKSILTLAVQNFVQLDSLPFPQPAWPPLGLLREWTEIEHNALQPQFEARLRTGSVRDCHGDLHLGNIVSLDGVLTPFDCIEFNPSLRWNDVMSEVAFLAMDLHDRGRPGLAWLFLNAYLEHSGDYAGVAPLRFYLVYRAMVRAKVHGVRAHQPGLHMAERERLLNACRGYIELATAFSRREHPVLIITHGLSGSGKSRITTELMQKLGAVRIRSDVERKRSHGLSAQTRGSNAVEAGIYGEQATTELYGHLVELARYVLAAGYPAIIDAACLKGWQRILLRELAQSVGATFVIADLEADEAVLRQRVMQRATEGKDASDAGLAVLEHQIATREPLSPRDRLNAVTISSEVSDPRACCEPLLGALRRFGT
jgi:uncharacterized protein